MIYNRFICIISIVVWYEVTVVSDKPVGSTLKVEMQAPFYAKKM